MLTASALPVPTPLTPARRARRRRLVLLAMFTSIGELRTREVELVREQRAASRSGDDENAERLERIVDELFAVRRALEGL